MIFFYINSDINIGGLTYFASPQAGWGLVREEGGRCSSQQAVTRCTYYERYTTPAALQAAAESYGGLTN